MLKKLITVTALFVFILPVFLYGQQQSRPASLAELDQFLVESAIRLDLRLRGLSGGSGGQTPQIGVGEFTIMDNLVPLSDIWRNGILDTLANIQNRTYTLHDAAVPSGEYLISGIILEAGSSIRITTRITRASDSSVIASWNSDLAKNSFTLELLENPGSSQVRRDRYETDSIGNPVPVEISGELVSRTIHNSDDRDFFLVRPEGGTMVTVETTGSSIDTMMELYSEEGELISSDDDGGSGENARIGFIAESGKSYTVMVKGYSSGTGDYGFRASSEPIPDRDREPNNSREQASPISIGESIQAALPSGDIDWYSLEIPEGDQRLIVFTEGDNDTCLSLYGSSGLLAEDDDSGSGSNARISKVLPRGTVYIKVSLYNESSSAVAYTLQTRIQSSPAGDQWEPDDSARQAKDIELNVSQTHNFGDGDDEDWVKFTVTRRGSYSIMARGASGPELDTVIELFDSDLDSIAEDDDGGERYSSRLSVDLDPGVYYIKVTTLDDNPEDDYTLLVRAE
ncbi:MAG: PPC domain-containing protein [Treponema sp.]|jgi:hypothetical protein|nr:PPC domain-containing protein [Treponema sp.]